MKFTSELLNFLADYSMSFGSGNVVADLLVILFALTIFSLFLGIVAVLRRTRAQRVALGGFDRMNSIAGKVERLERSSNEGRTEVVRGIELLRIEVDRLRGEVADLRRRIGAGGGGTSSGGTPSTGDGTPESGSGPDSGGFVTPVSRAQSSSIDAPIELEGNETYESPVLEPPSAPAVRTEPESLAARLVKTRSGFFAKLRGIFAGKPKLDPGSLEELEAALVSSDVGIATTTKLMTELKAEVEGGAELGEQELTALLKIKLLGILERNVPLMSEIRPIRRENGPLVVMVVGVNGAGKTTTVAKLAAKAKIAGAKVMMVAADTFRAAAVQQLVEWGSRVGVPVIRGADDAKPASVVFDAMKAAHEQGMDVVLIDTAGRLHTKSNLMQELEGVRNAISRHQEGAPHEVLLVVDGATGQNAISQAREFNQATALTGLVVTKLDGTPKGGVVVAIKEELGIPVRYIGVGESKEDLRPFSPREFVDALFEPSSEGGELEKPSAHGETRRRRRELGGAAVG